jgi:hypothetical protein
MSERMLFRGCRRFGVSAMCWRIRRCREMSSFGLFAHDYRNQMFAYFTLHTSRKCTHHVKATTKILQLTLRNPWTELSKLPNPETAQDLNVSH